MKWKQHNNNIDKYWGLFFTLWEVLRSRSITSALSKIVLVIGSMVRLVACETGKARKSYMLISQLWESSIEAIELPDAKKNE